MVDEKKKLLYRMRVYTCVFVPPPSPPPPPKKKIFRQMNKSTRDKLNKINAH